MLEQIKIALADRARELDSGEFKSFKAMCNFESSLFRINELGNLCYLEGKAMLGFMKLKTIVIQSVVKDMPLLSIDWIHVGAKYILIVEMFDTCLNPKMFDDAPFNAIVDSLSDVKDKPIKEAWYDELFITSPLSKGGMKRQNKAMEEAMMKYINAYIEMADSKEKLNDKDIARKKKKNTVYYEGLLANGGASTDVFKNHLGDDGTRQFFETVMFKAD